jgi:hypothetical protein
LTAPDEKLDVPFAVPQRYRLRFSTGVFQPDDRVLRGVLADAGNRPHRAAVFVDSGVAEAWPELGRQIMETMNGGKKPEGWQGYRALGRSTPVASAGIPSCW